MGATASGKPAPQRLADGRADRPGAARQPGRRDRAGAFLSEQDDRKGRVAAGGALFGRQHLKEKFARYVRRRMRDDVPCRLLVGHANCETDGQWLLDELTTGNVVYRRLLPCGTAFGVHGGPGLLVAAIQEYERPP